MENFNGIQIDEGEMSSPKPLGAFGFIFSKMVSDMKFVGLFTIIYGALSCLSIIGAVIGIPLIIAGLRLREAAEEYTIFQSISDNNALKRAFEKQQKYFNILKILIIVGLALLVLYIIFFIMFGLFAFSSISDYNAY
ncbi:MAG: DUF5362 domain-containing protein [Melioribacteraceae bacterium]|nr:DUF5362 domain-containing protein [Melioribacteraceae bacterium]